MAKTIMISNSAYEELKKLKDENKSFTDVVIELVSNKKLNTISNLWKYFGALKGDKEYKKLEKEIKAGWRIWGKRYA